jgi:hypothetical protein
VALKKPTEYFKKQNKVVSVDESIEQVAKLPEINTFSDAFESFKNNLSKIETLSSFSDTLDNYRINVERINHISEKVDSINEEIQSHLKKEDLDHAMMAQLLVVEDSLKEVQAKVKGINEKNLTEIRIDVSTLTDSVNDFLENDVPKYKKLIVDSEFRTDKRFTKFEENINETLEGIGELVDKKYLELTETLEGINEKSLSSILEDFKLVEESLKKIQEEEIPKYKGFIVETERKTESKLDEYDEKLSTTLTSFNSTITENLNNTLDKLSLIEDNKNQLISEVTQKFKELKELSHLISKEVETNASYKEQIKERVAGLEVNILRNEKHIKDQNKNLQEIEEEVKDTLSKINVEEIERQNHKLAKKIKYLEEVFEKFSEKEILSENNFTEPPSVKNTDPVTPLDQNFVTLDQLQQHYRLFINRVQQQLATLGGGGETRLKYLDDIVGIATNPAAYDGKFLRYNHPEKNFEFVTVEAGGPTDNITTNSISIVDNESDTQYFDEVVTLQKATTAVTNTTNPTSIHKAISISNYATVEYLIQATKGLSVNTVKLLSVNDTININTIEAYSASIGSTFVNYSINIDDGFVNLIATPNDISTIVYNISYTAITRQNAEFIIKTEDDQIILTEDGDMIQTEVA